LFPRILIIEGIITIAYAFVAKFLIPDWPETAKFLNTEEKALLAKRLKEDLGNGSARMDVLNKAAVKLILSDWKIWVA
jgi:hypothetical protein